MVESWSLRKIFHWKHSFGLIPSFWAIGLGLVSIDASGLAGLAYFFFALGTVWSLGFWLTSDFLRKKNPRGWSRNIRKRGGKQSAATYLAWKWGVSTCLVGVFVAAVIQTNAISERKELLNMHGVLLPAHDPNPPNPCGDIPADAMAVFYGNSAMYARGKSFSLLEIGPTSLLTIDKDETGSAALTADIRSADGKIIARISRSEFTVNPNNILSMKRPDRSSLIIDDQYGHTVLNVRYLNPKAIKVLGLFYYAPNQAFDIRDDRQVLGGGETFSRGCLGGGGMRIGPE